MHSARQLVGSHDIVLITLDTLRYDVALECFRDRTTPNLASKLPREGWEQRHSPGSFTFAAHQAFFAGFLPTPAAPGIHPRLFAAEFPGSETTSSETFVHEAPTWVEGLQRIGYHTICIGGVGFFSKSTPLGSVLPNLFEASYWSSELGVTSETSTEKQVDLACRLLKATPTERRILLFINISAIHQPNCIFAPGATTDSPATQSAALRYVDQQIPPLFEACVRRAPSFWIVCSDHGTAYGEEGYQGHRLAHPVVWTVPYAEFILARDSNQSGAAR